MDLVFGFLAGLLTLINPCVLPVIPLALASATAQHRLGPLTMAAGMGAAFTLLGVLTASLGPAAGLSGESVSEAGAALMVLFGLVLLAPPLARRFTFATAGLATAASTQIRRMEGGGLAPLFAGGALLGAVWSPCIGPTLGGAIGLASQGGSLLGAGSVMLAFSAGVGAVFVALAYGTREALQARREGLARLAHLSKPLMGAVMVGLGVAILLNWHHMAEAALLDVMPVWIQDLSVSL
ncbi:MAG: cytochrome c biogenesis protein CcdA [Rhizobiaceae bacterium]|nr:MAG: cytochrome c biogenesis protein CcdA [Rhizobiaceae bacterium]